MTPEEHVKKGLLIKIFRLAVRVLGLNMKEFDDRLVEDRAAS